jgi:SAM-dependent methyltransferase
VGPGTRLREQFGDIDIYLFDQLLRGRFDRGRVVLDAGCGGGRNLVYFLRNGFTCHGVDHDADAIEAVRALAARVAPDLPPANFQTAPLDALPLPDGMADSVICSAVLHFAEDEAHFGRMVTELWRVLAPGGIFFARLASNIGLEREIGAARRRARLPDGSTRFVVDTAMLLEWSARLGGRLLDPIKTTNVQQMRGMTTWCLAKGSTNGEE